MSHGTWVVVGTLVAILALFTTGVTLDIGPFANQRWADILVVDNSIRMLIALMVVMILTRRSLVKPNNLLPAVIWLLVVYITHRLILRPGSETPFEIAMQNVSEILVTVMAAVVGAHIGIWIRERFITRDPGAN